jgi:cysteine desulfurase / selenocysteine lyase
MMVPGDSSACIPPNRFDVNRLRLDFPIFREQVHGKPFIYLDSAATTQKPFSVIDAIAGFYSRECASVHRSIYYLSERATESYENTREKVRRFINAASSREIVFVRGTTEAINLVAQSYARNVLKSGDEILITGMEHHSNIVPWQLVCHEKGAILRAAPIDCNGELDLEHYASLLGPKTRLVAITYVSNALGTVNPIREIVRLAHQRNIPVLIDAAQAVSHFSIDVQALDCDFLAFSAHKMYGPNGIGVLYGKERFLDAMPPYQAGGDMVLSVTLDRTVYQDPPHKFEAGTPNVADVIGLGAAIDYLCAIGLDSISAHEQSLIRSCTKSLSAIDALQIIGQPKDKAGVISFLLDGVHPHDIGTILDREGIAIRAGNHCAQPIMDSLGIQGTARVSLGLYNTSEDIEALLRGLRKVKEVFR